LPWIFDGWVPILEIFIQGFLFFFDIPYLALYNQVLVLRLGLNKESRPKLNPNQAILGV
jgi:hypothetical protein